jgi:translation initiation factor IF-3
MQLAEDVSEFGVVEQRPNLDGRNMTMLLAPLKPKEAAGEEAAQTPDGEAPAEPAAETPAESAAAETPAVAAERPEAPTEAPAPPAAAADENSSAA